MKAQPTTPRQSFTRSSLRALAVILPAAMAILPVSTVASGAASICRQIEHRLGVIAKPQRQDSNRLDRAIRQSRAAGCGSTGLASPHDTHCRVHAQRIQDMQRFSSQPSGYAQGDLRRERARLASALRVNGCVGQPVKRAREVKVDRLGTPILTVDGSIPVPMPRPASPAETYEARYVEHGRSRQAALDLALGEKLARPRELPTTERNIRVVGGGFLPEPDAETNFKSIATNSQNPANGFLVGLLAFVEGAIVTRAVAADH